MSASPGGMVDDEPPPIVNAPYRFWGGVVGDIRSMVSRRSLLRSFVARELRQRYKGSIIGWGWALARPLVMLIVYGVAVGVFLGAGQAVPDYAIYVYTGLIAWSFFSTLITGSINALPYNAGLIRKAAFPRELLIVAVLVVALLDLVIQASVLVIAYLVVGDWPEPAALIWLIPAVFLLTLIGVGLGLALSAANVYYRDVGYLTEVGLQVGFWLIPIVYTYQMVASTFSAHPQLLMLYSANPLVSAVNGFRFALWPPAAQIDGAGQLLSTDVTLTLLFALTLLALVLLWLAQRFFARVAANIAQEL